MSEGYEHWHTDMPIQREREPRQDREDYDNGGYSAADAARDDERDRIANADDAGVC